MKIKVLKVGGIKKNNQGCLFMIDDPLLNKR